MDGSRTEEARSSKVEIGGIVYDLSPSAWSGTRWRDFIRHLTPRERIYHVRAWQLLAESRPELRLLVAHAIDEIRQIFNEPRDDWFDERPSHDSHVWN